MSVETSRTNQPGDGDSDDETTYGYRSADSAAVDGDLDDDELDDDTVASADDDDEDDDAPVVQGTVYESSTTEYGTTDSGYGTTDSGVTDYGTTADPDAVVTDVDDPQPTFTPVDDTAVDDGTVDDTAVDEPVYDGTDANAPTLSESDDVPVVDDAATTPVTEAPLSSATDLDPNAPLLGDSVSLRASWQQAQAGFVDDPRTAVSEAAELVEQAAQTLIGTLQQKQSQLRNQWENNGSGDLGADTTGSLSDTEQLRHLMQDYRTLFNQLVQP